ncbi:MAG: UvrD-helicase domain-containing protein [Oscillospiraceae bacterium]|nr:UvrD-helicase domain-containing protein [Oscillospiraceae bacterium]
MEAISLNAAQTEAVTTTEGYVRVIAGAGSGKTRALTERFAFLVNELGILPGNILCVTFTNKAANEMRQRIHRLTGDNDTGLINTFHGFCVSVLQEDGHALQYPKRFLVLDNADIDDMLRVIYAERDLSLRDMSFAAARDMIEMQKLYQRPDYYLDLIDLSLEALRTRYEQAQGARDIIFSGYLYQQKKCFGLDYNDLIKLTLYLFQRDADIRLKWQRRLEYILIDEFQDIDALQYELMDVLCAYHKNLFLVGDPDQTIYTWRGANVKFLLDFPEKHPGTHTILMTENYRSTPQILAVANSLIEKNRSRVEKVLRPTRPDGARVLCHHAKSAEAEADWIAGQIAALHAAGTSYRDITVLYRAHYVSRAVEEALLRAKIPYAISSGVPFFARAEIKDALSYLRLLVCRDDLSFRRVANSPKRNLGRRRMAYLEECAEKERCSLYEALCRSLEDEVLRGTKGAELVGLVERLSADWEDRAVSELLSAVLDASGYEAMLRTEGSQERLDNLAELKQSVRDYETTCGEEATPLHYLAHVALLTKSDAADGGDRVKLMTVHAAKGLEFSCVFLCGMNEGVFPSRKTATLPGMEEERRLAFVAMTRARQRLFLSEAEGWTPDGAPRWPSRFLLDIDPTLLDFTAPPKEELLREARAFIALRSRALAEQLPQPFPPGRRVRHAVFGSGTVLEADRDRGAHLVRFDSLPTPRAISFRAKLEPEDESPAVEAPQKNSCTNAGIAL